MKRWRVRWRDEHIKKIFFWSEHVSSQIWCYLKLVRWRDEEWDEEMKRWRDKNFFLVWTCIKPNLVLSEISEKKRWTDEENVFWSKHVSSQIWCYLKLVRWRVRWRDEQMKKIFFGSEHVSNQIWCYLKLVRWRDEEWDEQMNRWRKFFLVRTCIKPNLVLSEISEMKSEMKRWQKIFLGPNMYQAKSGVKNFSLYWAKSGVIWN